MTLKTKHTPMPLQLLGAAMLTALAFGVGPVVGFVGGDDDGWTSLAASEAQAAPAAAPVALWARMPEVPPPLPAPPELADRLDGDAEPVAAAQPELPGAAEATVMAALSAPSLAVARPRGPTLASTNVAATVAPKTTSSRSKRSRGCDAEPSAAIEKTGSGSWTVQRDLVQSYARSLKKLNSLGWSTPHEGADGKNDGMLIGGVRCGSDLHLAGMRSGDVVHTINGREVKSFPQALLVYNKVKKDDTIEVQLTRRGKPTSLTYRLDG